MQLIWFKGIQGEVECRKKYKELVKLHHPDKHTHEGNKQLAEKKFKEIGIEYEWLSKNSWNVSVNSKFGNNNEEFTTTWKQARQNSNNPWGFNTRVTDDDVDWSNPFTNPNDYLREQFAKAYERIRRNQTKDLELEELIEFVNFNLANPQIASIKNRKNRIKAVIYSVCTTWLMQEKNVTLQDFERLQKALGIERGDVNSSMWFYQFKEMFSI